MITKKKSNHNSINGVGIINDNHKRAMLFVVAIFHYFPLKHPNTRI